MHDMIKTPLKRRNTAAAWVVAGCMLLTASCQMVEDSQHLSGVPIDTKAAAKSRAALASEYIANNQLDAAKRSLAQALKDDPKSAEANHMMAILLLKEGSPSNRPKAEEYFKKALRLQKDFPAAWNNYGVFLRQDLRYAEAMDAFETAGSTLGYDARGQALENMGRTALMMGNSNKAKSAFERAIQADNGLIIPYLELAELLFQEHNIADANANFQRYVQLLGTQKMGARSLWLGVRLADTFENDALLQHYAEQLSRDYPNSPENIQSLNLLKGIQNHGK